MKEMRIKQIERIRRMEGLLDFAILAMKEPATTVDKNVKLKQAIASLSEYYTSPEWKQDFADDEAGLLPKDLKRGVLSEDGIWNLLSDWQKMKRMKNEE